MHILASRHINKNKKYFYNSIKKKLDNNEIVYIVVPEQFTLGTEIEAYKELGIESTINLRIKSFKTIVNEVLHYNGGRALEFLSDSAKYLIIQMILLDIREDLRVYHRNVYDKKFIDMIINFLDEIVSNRKCIDDLIAISKSEKISDSLKLKLKDIILIANKFNDVKEVSKFHNVDRNDLAIFNICNVTQYKNISFYFDRFNDMSIQELDIISEINKVSKFTLINLVLDSRLINDKDKFNIEDLDVFDISLKFYKSICNKISDIKYIDTDIGIEKELSNVEVLLNNVFSYNLQGIEKRFYNSKLDNIYINRLNNTNEEVENLAISIKKDIIDNGYKYNQIAVLATNGNEYFSKIKKNFKLNNIPYFIDEKRNLLDNPMIKYLKSGVNLLSSGLSTQSVIQFLKSSFLSFTDFELNIFCSYIERRKIQGEMFFEDKYFSVKEENNKYIEEDKENLNIVKNVKNKFTYILEEKNIREIIFSNKLKESTSYFTEVIYNFFSNKNLLEAYSDIEEIYEESTKEENKLIWESFIETLDNFYIIVHENFISLDIYLEVLTSAIDNFSIGIIPPSQDNVIVGDVKRSRFNSVKKLYVIGMSNLYYPVVNNEVDILLDDEKLELIDNGFNVRNINSNIISNDLISFYIMLNSALDEIVFSYSLINSSNEAMTNAPIINWIKAMTLKENSNIKDIEYKDFAYTNTKISTYLPSKLLELKTNKRFSNEEKDYIFKLYNEVKKNKDKYNNINYALELSNRNLNRVNISPDIAKLIYNENKFSVSQLEKFNSNPYEHFIIYGIKPRVYDSYDISRVDVGNLTHEFLSNYFANIYNLHNNEVEADEVFENALIKLLDEYKFEDMRNKYFLGQMKNNSKAYANIIKKQLDISSISNIYFEQYYGENSNFHAIKLDVDGVEIKIEGKIDRIDEFDFEGNKYYRVVDYKTGNKKFEIQKVYYGVDLQLLLYLRATVEGNSKAKPLGAFYQKLNNGISYEMIKNSEEDFTIPNELKLDGIINDSLLLYSYVDNKTNPDIANSSNIYSFTGRKYKFEDKDNTISEKMFYKLFEHNENLIKDSIRRIKNGEIVLRPYKLGDKEDSYKYNNYKTIDKEEGLKYEYLDKLDWDYVKNKLGN